MAELIPDPLPNLVKEFELVSVSCGGMFEDEVNKLLRDGWEIETNLSTHSDGERNYYTIGLSRYKEKI